MPIDQVEKLRPASFKLMEGPQRWRGPSKRRWVFEEKAGGLHGEGQRLRVEGQGLRGEGQGLRGEGQGLRGEGQGLRGEGQGASPNSTEVRLSSFIINCLYLCLSFSEGHTLKGVGLRVADSHTGNHRKDGFTPLETFGGFPIDFGM
ncbi:hypothetical protein Tco_1483642 [Tanacetum coccineum]